MTDEKREILESIVGKTLKKSKVVFERLDEI